MSKSPQRSQSSLQRFVGLSRKTFWTTLQSAASYFATIVEKVFDTIVGTFATVVVRECSQNLM
jgi:hypothetical protein